MTGQVENACCAERLRMKRGRYILLTENISALVGKHPILKALKFLMRFDLH